MCLVPSWLLFEGGCYDLAELDTTGPSLGIILTLAILTNFVAMGFGPPPSIIVFAPLIPLALLLFSGLYMFFLPYRQKDHRS